MKHRYSKEESEMRKIARAFTRKQSEAYAMKQQIANCSYIPVKKQIKVEN